MYVSSGNKLTYLDVTYLNANSWHGSLPVLQPEIIYSCCSEWLFLKPCCHFKKWCIVFQASAFTRRGRGFLQVCTMVSSSCGIIGCAHWLTSLTSMMVRQSCGWCMMCMMSFCSGTERNFDMASFTGPVRGIDFHKQQPLFVSGGDDYKIKVKLRWLASKYTATLNHS